MWSTFVDRKTANQKFGGCLLEIFLCLSILHNSRQPFRHQQ
uniref:Uncharacterized protein n=1 Tax=Arundo donax TaxID=35708 RepID=A0A0A9HLR3_ARUDO